MPSSASTSRWNPFVNFLASVISTIFPFFSYYRILIKDITCTPWSFLLKLKNSYIFHSFPAMQFRKNVKQSAIFLGEFEEEEWLRFLPKCAHALTFLALILIQFHSNCPLCRSHATYNSTGQHVYTISVMLVREAPQERAASNQVVWFETRWH